jgi:hypothetical protein
MYFSVNDFETLFEALTGALPAVVRPQVTFRLSANAFLKVLEIKVG